MDFPDELISVFAFDTKAWVNDFVEDQLAFEEPATSTATSATEPNSALTASPSSYEEEDEEALGSFIDPVKPTMANAMLSRASGMLKTSFKTTAAIFWLLFTPPITFISSVFSYVLRAARFLLSMLRRITALLFKYIVPVTLVLSVTVVLGILSKESTRLGLCDSTIMRFANDVTPLGRVMSCPPLGAPLDLKDPAFIDLLPAIQSARKVTKQLTRGFQVPAGLDACWMPECSEMKHRMQRDSITTMELGINVSNTIEDVRLLVERMIYDSNSSTLVFEIANRSDNPSILPQTHFAVASYNADRVKVVRQELDGIVGELAADVLEKVIQYRDEMCTAPNTAIEFKPSSFSSHIVGVYWEAEIVSRNSGTKKRLSISSQELEALNFGQGNFTAVHRRTCARAQRTEFALSHLYRRLVALRDVMGGPPSLAARLDPVVQVVVFRAGLDELTEELLDESPDEPLEVPLEDTENKDEAFRADTPAEGRTLFRRVMSWEWGQALGWIHAFVQICQLMDNGNPRPAGQPAVAARPAPAAAGR